MGLNVESFKDNWTDAKMDTTNMGREEEREHRFNIQTNEQARWGFEEQIYRVRTLLEHLAAEWNI